MAPRLSCVHQLFLALALVFVVTNLVLPGVEAGQCQTVLAASGCNLGTCRQQCAQQKNGRGVCVPNTQRTDYQCQCFYNCPAQLAS